MSKNMITELYHHLIENTELLKQFNNQSKLKIIDIIDSTAKRFVNEINQSR